MSKSRARNASGQFTKKRSGGGTKKRRSKSKALARRGSTAPATRSRSSSVARRGSTQVRRRRSSGGGLMVGGGVVNGTIRTLKHDAPEYVASGLYGYVTAGPPLNANGEASLAFKAREYLDKVPTWSKIGKPASHGVLAIAVGIAVGGKYRRYFGLAAKAALHRAAFNVGSTGFDVEKAAQLAGDDDNVHLAGDITDADVVG